MKVNKSIIIYSATIISLVALSLVSINNLFPLAVQHTLYYCQTALKFPSQILLSIVLVILFIPWLKLIFIVYKTLMFREKLKLSKQIQEEVYFLASRYNLEKKILVFESSEAYAFCLGIRKPYIYLSTRIIEIMSTKELEAVILHEKYHLENHDNISLLLLSFAKQFLIMFPIFSDILQNFMSKKEVEADQAVVTQLNSKKELISAFVKLFKVQRIHLPATSYFTEPSTIENRINALLTKKLEIYSYRLRNIGISAVSFVLLLTIMWLPVYKTEVHAKNTDEVMICLQHNSCGDMCINAHPMSHTYF